MVWRNLELLVPLLIQVNLNSPLPIRTSSARTTRRKNWMKTNLRSFLNVLQSLRSVSKVSVSFVVMPGGVYIVMTCYLNGMTQPCFRMNDVNCWKKQYVSEIWAVRVYWLWHCTRSPHTYFFCWTCLSLPSERRQYLSSGTSGDSLFRDKPKTAFTLHHTTSDSVSWSWLPAFIKACEVSRTFIQR